MKISVIITAHNYAKYLPECIDSVLNQTYDNYEIIVVNDGSTDNTEEILAYYEKNNPGKIKIVTLAGVGLATAANTGVKHSRGEYIIRLDADDYFDSNILLIESNVLDRSPNIDMVFSDYYTITKHGELIDSFRYLKVNDEVKLLDRSPLAAGAMYRRKCFEALGGYNETLKYQEDYDFWIRFIDRYNVENVNLPLMYYRQHARSMSNNFEGRMAARQYVKKKFVNEKEYRQNKNIVGIIPAMGLFRNKEKLSLRNFCGEPLIAYAIKGALASGYIDRLIVSTEDEEIAEIARAYGAEVPFLRPLELSRTSVPFEKVLTHLLGVFKQSGQTIPDIFAVLPYGSPFRTQKHIDEAIDTLLLYDTDSVIGVTTDLTFHWKPGKYGLESVGYQKRRLREDKETIYQENAAIYVIKSSNLLEQNSYLGNLIGHIEMSPKTAWRIENDFSFWVAEKIMKEQQMSRQRVEE